MPQAYPLPIRWLICRDGFRFPIDNPRRDWVRERSIARSGGFCAFRPGVAEDPPTKRRGDVWFLVLDSRF
jgi:hypothetical protein